MYVAMNGDALCTGSGQRFDIVAGNDAPLPNDSRPRAVVLYLGQDMAGDKYGGSLSVSLLQKGKKFPLHQGIESAGGFVQNEEIRRMLKRADDCHLLAVAEGQLRNPAGRIKLQAVAQDGGFRGAVPPPQTGGQLQDVFDLSACIEYCFRGKVTDSGQNRFPIIADIHAEYLCGAGVRADQSEQGADRRGLACAVGADKAEELTLLYREV